MEPSMNYTVREIKDKRIVDGKIEYLVGWTGFSQGEDTWELKEELIGDSHCKGLIDEYEKSLKAEEGECDRAPSAAAKANTPSAGRKSNRTGFDRGLEPSKIKGATKIGGNLLFLIQWKDTDETEFVPASVANLKCPQMVIKFYQDRLTYHEKM